ncbi:hypothetical protein Rsub_02301 [Raphidocelis subcapitata]|uniref:Uncharacterized protein n=1 Tax=Raphidocelis subcapitata TaxID=307507 RepID=A0A2V0NVK3_9CHLO|nr:hypothetical protein Rsub_02301 [Raphidocelis subcapitata]|eukprot:GBF89583.1 hypothetical protein Rsub_02301 [Raphidocelis subcapitata]
MPVSALQALAAAGTSGKCNTNPGTTGGTGAYCDCSYPLNGAACGSCCYDFKCAASMEACPCRDSSECVDIATNKQAGCCSKTLAQHTGNTDGKCSKQLVGGPSGDAFCDCADESLAPIGLSCPASSQPGPVVTCCAVSSKSWYPWWAVVSA